MSFECRTGTQQGRFCTVKYTVAFDDRVRDDESLVVTFKMANQPDQSFTFHNWPTPGGWGEHYVTFAACGTVNVEVNANPGTNARSIASRFRVAIQSSKCHDCQTT